MTDRRADPPDSANTANGTNAQGFSAPSTGTSAPRAITNSDQLGKIIGRAFGLIWLVFVLNIVEFFLARDFSPVGGTVAWASLALFTLADIVLIAFGNPLWASRAHRDIVINRTLIWLMITINVGFVLAFREEDFGYFFIYAAVNSGMFLARSESFRMVALLTALTLAAGLYSEAPSTEIFTSMLLVGGIGMNTVFWSALMAQNRELRRARAEITRLAVAEERLRFARDLHDLLGHSLSLIALKSELAGRLLTARPERAASEIADVEHVARTALQEVRDAVTGYRTPSLGEELSNAQQMLTAAGISVRIQSSVTDLPTEVDRVLAWFVREGTTNVIRHAEATTVIIAISHAKREIFAEMTNHGHRDSGNDATFPDQASQETGGSGGVGLTGLRERIRACNGTLSSGPVPGAGFRLYARIPIPANDERANTPHPTIAHFPAVKHAQERVAP